MRHFTHVILLPGSFCYPGHFVTRVILLAPLCWSLPLALNVALAYGYAVKAIT